MAFLGILVIVRTHLLRVFCGPLGGIVADRVKSPALLLIYCFAVISIMMVVFMLLPTGTSVVVAIGLQLFLATVVFAAYSILYSCVEAAGVPRKLTGTNV